MIDRVKPVIDRTTNLVHFVGWVAGVKDAQATALTFCGMDPKPMQKARWFDIGDAKGDVFFGDKVHDTCREGLAI